MKKTQRKPSRRGTYRALVSVILAVVLVLVLASVALGSVPTTWASKGHDSARGGASLSSAVATGAIQHSVVHMKQSVVPKHASTPAVFGSIQTTWASMGYDTARTGSSLTTASAVLNETAQRSMVNLKLAGISKAQVNAITIPLTAILFALFGMALIGWLVAAALQVPVVRKGLGLTPVIPAPARLGRGESVRAAISTRFRPDTGWSLA